MSVAKTLLKQDEIQTPLIIANEASIGKLAITNMDSAYIKNLEVDILTIKDENSSTTSASDQSEVYDTASFNEIVLNFSDEYNCVYTLADETILESTIDGKLVNISFVIPEELGAKLVCRYMVLDLRNEPVTTNVGVVWPDNCNINWLYGTPDIQAGYFYVLAFQRFSKDLFVGNVAIKLDGGNV